MQLPTFTAPGQGSVPEIGVVHLVREVYGPAPLRSFLASYRTHEPGSDHELILPCKGFGGDTLPAAWTRLLEGIPHRAIFLGDEGMDIPSYFRVAGLVKHRYLCFVNTWSRIRADGWLALLHAQLTVPGVGIVGASGAWWSLHTVSSLRLQQRMEAVGRGSAPLAAPPATPPLRARESLARLERDFPPFPNPFLRTNGFLVERELFLSLRGGAGLTRHEALAFESGRDSMTRQVAWRGLKVLVVGRDGAAYSPLEWPASRTYRSGDQENLLIADNRTEMYSRADRCGKELLRWLIWGDAPENGPHASFREVRGLSLAAVPHGRPVFTG